MLLSETAKTAWRTICGNLKELTWKTQTTLPDGRRPDLVVQSSTEYLFVVEAKIGSPIRVYDPADSNSGGELEAKFRLEQNHINAGKISLQNQLECYGTWRAWGSSYQTLPRAEAHGRRLIVAEAPALPISSAYVQTPRE